MGEPESLWGKETWKGLIDETSLINRAKRDLVYKVNLPSEFKGLRVPLDKEVLISLVRNNNCGLNVPGMLLTSISEYVGKEKNEIDFMDLIQMYQSIVEIFDGDVGYNELKKLTKANKLSRFGRSQYELMEKYAQNKFP